MARRVACTWMDKLKRTPNWEDRANVASLLALMYAVTHMLQDNLRKLVVILSNGSIDRLLIPHTPCIILVPIVVSFVPQHHVTAS